MEEGSGVVWFWEGRVEDTTDSEETLFAVDDETEELVEMLEFKAKPVEPPETVKEDHDDGLGAVMGSSPVLEEGLWPVGR